MLIYIQGPSGLYRDAGIFEDRTYLISTAQVQSVSRQYTISTAHVQTLPCVKCPCSDNTPVRQPLSSWYLIFTAHGPSVSPLYIQSLYHLYNSCQGSTHLYSPCPIHISHIYSLCSVFTPSLPPMSIA